MRASDLKIVFAAFCLLLSGCADTCGNEISQSIVSPDRKMRAVVFNRNCGATTGLNTQLSVIPTSAELPGEEGNVYIAEHTVPIALRWVSETVLEVSARPSDRIFKHQDTVNGVSVRYSGQNQP